MAKLDACNPRDMTVALPKDEDPEVLIWPSCTRARRCGGCCNSETYSCEPVETRPRHVTVRTTTTTTTTIEPRSALSVTFHTLESWFHGNCRATFRVLLLVLLLLLIIIILEVHLYLDEGPPWPSG